MPNPQGPRTARGFAAHVPLEPFRLEDDLVVFQGDALRTLRKFPGESVNCCVTSVPYYGMRDYGVAAQQGLETTVDLYIAGMVAVFAEVRRILTRDGTCWLNIGDTMNNRTRLRTSAAQGINGVDDSDESWEQAARRGRVRMSHTGGNLKEKDLMLVPERLALALQADGWWVRSNIVWVKDTARDSAKDRPARSWEHVFLLTRAPNYWFNLEALRERYYGGAFSRNGRNVWSIHPSTGVDGHAAPMPQELARRCIEAGCRPGGVVLDPYLGSATTAIVARRTHRQAVGIELSEDYVRVALERLDREPRRRRGWP